MADPLSPRLAGLRVWASVAAMMLLPLAARAQLDSNATSTANWDIADFLDRLPNLNPFGNLSPNAPFPIRYYASPRLGDFLRRDYLRLPVGARAQITEHFDSHVELGSYFTHGLKGSAGYGLSELRFGSKYEEAMDAMRHSGWSVGADFDTPLSRPPLELTDGHRHFLPYLTASDLIAPDSNLVGYASVGADLLSHTALPANFGRNELHGNSLVLTTGLTRNYKLFRVALTGTYSTTALLTNENHTVIALRPDILVPLVRRQSELSRTHLLFILSGRAVNGPDGTELGVTGNIRIEFSARSPHNKPKN